MLRSIQMLLALVGAKQVARGDGRNRSGGSPPIPQVLASNPCPGQGRASSSRNGGTNVRKRQHDPDHEQHPRDSRKRLRVGHGSKLSAVDPCDLVGTREIATQRRSCDVSFWRRHLQVRWRAVEQVANTVTYHRAGGVSASHAVVAYRIRQPATRPGGPQGRGTRRRPGAVASSTSRAACRSVPPVGPAPRTRRLDSLTSLRTAIAAGSLDDRSTVRTAPRSVRESSWAAADLLPAPSRAPPSPGALRRERPPTRA